jgi:hypothetical protein
MLLFISRTYSIRNKNIGQLSDPPPPELKASMAVTHKIRNDYKEKHAHKYMYIYKSKIEIENIF